MSRTRGRNVKQCTLALERFVGFGGGEPLKQVVLRAIFAIHSDARTYEHRPELVMKTREEAAELARSWQKNWSKKQLGYYMVSTLDGTTIGFTGVRHSKEACEEVLNLYYRFALESQGQGYAKEAAAAAIANAHEHFPQLPVVAIIDPANEASIGSAL